MIKSACIAAASLLTLSLTTTATAQMVYDGVIFDFTESGQGLWELVPAVIRDGTNNHMLLAVQKSRAEPRDVIRKLTTSGNLQNAVWNPATSQLVFDRDKMFGFSHNAHHVGDPTILAFNRFYGSTFYKWRMFFTYDDRTSPCHDAICNEIGMTFSNDLVNWTVSSAASFVPDVLPQEYPIASTQPDWWRYGVGMNDTVWDAAAGRVLHLYSDTSQHNVGEHRVVFRRETPTSVLYSFGPINSIPFHTRIDEALQPYLGSSIPFIGNVALAFHNTSSGRRWYVAISAGIEAVYLLRSRTDGEVQSVEWDVIGIVDSALTGFASNVGPGFAKSGDGSLYVENGWAFIFLGVGPTNLWNLRMGQVRFQP